MRHRNKRPKLPNNNGQAKNELCKEIKKLEAELIPRPRKPRYFNGDTSEKGIAYTQTHIKQKTERILRTWN